MPRSYTTVFLSLHFLSLSASGLAAGASRQPHSVDFDFTPQQRMLNRGLADLEKGILFLNYPIPAPIDTPDICSLEPERGITREPFVADLPFGAFRKRGSSGQVQAEGKFIGISPDVACLDIGGDGCTEGDPKVIADGNLIELTGMRDAFGPTLSPGCADFEFWDGFQLGSSGEASFTTRAKWEPPQVMIEAKILQVVGGSGIIPGIFTGSESGLKLVTSAVISNTSPFDVEAILEKWNGMSGSPEGTEFFPIPGNRSRRKIFMSMDPFSRGWARIINFDSMTARSISTATGFELRSQAAPFEPSGPAGAVLSGAGEGQVLGVAGLGSPRPAGEHTLFVSRSDAGASTGVLIVNPNFLAANLFLTLFDDQDQQAGEAPLVMAPFTSVSQFFLQYFGLEPAGAFEDFEGTLVISGDAPTSVVTLATQDGIQQFSLPAGSNRIGPN